MRVTLDQATNVAMIVTCAVVTATLGSKYLTNHKSTVQSTASYVIGDRIPESVPIDMRAAEQTLVLFVRDGCHFCTESMGFYRNLVHDRKDPASLRFVVASSDSPDVSQRYLSANQLSVDGISHVAPGQLNARGTPTLILVGKDRKVRGAWIGKLSTEREDEVRRALKL
jgi:hypothetical protein